MTAAPARVYQLKHFNYSSIQLTVNATTTYTGFKKRVLKSQSLADSETKPELLRWLDQMKLDASRGVASSLVTGPTQADRSSRTRTGKVYPDD